MSNGNDPKPMAKPYLAPDMDYLKMYRVQTWEDGEPTRNDDSEYSEFQKPYQYDEDEPEDYAFWEWTWPDIGNVPTDPDLVPDPCSIDEDCVWAGAIGPDEMECGDCFTYSQAHLWLGCTSAPWWAAYGRWLLLNSTDNKCYLLFSGPVMATVCCAEDAESQGLKLRYEGALNCWAEKFIQVSCEVCCEAFSLTGSDTVNPGNTWEGTITPSCPGVECEVTSDSGCSLACVVDLGGGLVTVEVGAADCGTFYVSLSHNPTKPGCTPRSAGKGVRILNTGQGGTWQIVLSPAVGTCDVECNTGCTSPVGAGPCIYDNEVTKKVYKYGRVFGADPCGAAYLMTCKGCVIDGCTDSGTLPKPPCFGGQTCAEAGTSSGFCGGSGDDRLCPCTAWSYTICDWRCTC